MIPSHTLYFRSFLFESKDFHLSGSLHPCTAHVTAGAARERAPAGLRVLCRELVGNMRLASLQVT